MINKTYLQLETVNCCICNHNNATLAGRGKDFEYSTSADVFTAFECKSCGLIYLNPRPSVKEFEKIYPSNYHAFDFSEKEFGFIHKVRSRLEANRLLKHCRDLPADARILDVGCGDGFHLKLLQNFGNKSWILEGIDMDKKAVAKAKESGLNVYEGTVENANLTIGSYDLIIMIMTIEHVERPDNVLKAAYQLLKKGGRVVIVTDNTGSFDFRFFKNSHWGGYHFPRHWNLFNKQSLFKLAVSQGFDTSEIKTIISPVNWVYSIHNKLVDKGYPKWISNRFTLKSTLSLTVFTAFDFILQLFGRGALLQATLKK